MIKQPSVCIIIVTWKKEEYVMTLLESLANLNYDNKDILVIDNNSTDYTVSNIKKSYPNTLIIINSENLGGAGGFNVGLRYVLSKHEKYDYCWLLDNDVVVHKNSLRFLVDTLEENPEAALCGSKIFKIGTNQIQECGGFIDWNNYSTSLYRAGVLETENDKANDKKVVLVDYCAACSLLARIKDVKKFGIMDEGMFVFWDDIEWSTRFKKAGKQIFCDQRSFVHHYFHGDKPDEPWRAYYRVRNHLFFFSNYCSNLQKDRAIKKIILDYLTHTKNIEAYGFEDIAKAVHIGIKDFLKGKRGKWGSQFSSTVFGSDVSDNLPLIVNPIFIHYGKIHNNVTHEKTKNYVWNSHLPITTKVYIIFLMITQKSVFITNKPHILILFCSHCIFAQNNKFYLKRNNNKMSAIYIYISNRIKLSIARKIPKLTNFLFKEDLKFSD